MCEPEEEVGRGGPGVRLDPERGQFVNAAGLKLCTYAWRANALMNEVFTAHDQAPASVAQKQNGEAKDRDESVARDKKKGPRPSAVVVIVHGYCVHARYECLQPTHPGAHGHDKYEGSIAHRLNEVGCDVHAFDLQGHGESERRKGLRCYASDMDDFARDVIQFTKLVKESYTDGTADEKSGGYLSSRKKAGAAPPIFIVGASMGGLVVCRAVQMKPNMAQGMALLAPGETKAKRDSTLGCLNGQPMHPRDCDSGADTDFSSYSSHSHSHIFLRSKSNHAQ